MVHLQGFELKGGKWANLRQTASRAVRDGLEFAVIEPEEVPAVMNELAEVSDSWLADHNAKEKGFSLGAFDPVAVASWASIGATWLGGCCGTGPADIASLTAALD